MPTVMTLLPVVTFWIRRYFREALVTALVAKAVLAVVGVPKRVVREPLGMAPTVTVPEMAGNEPMVTELPTVTVPEMGMVSPNGATGSGSFVDITQSFIPAVKSAAGTFAVTVPEMAGREPMVTDVAIVFISTGNC